MLVPFDSHIILHVKNREKDIYQLVTTARNLGTVLYNKLSEERAKEPKLAFSDIAGLMDVAICDRSGGGTKYRRMPSLPKAGNGRMA